MNLFVWREVFPEYHIRLLAMSQAVYMSFALADTLRLVPKD
jgi:hypothetical protein